MIGIIGYGRFGKLVSHYLAQDLAVYVYNRSEKSSDIVRSGAQPASLEKVCQQDIVIPCVPISTFRDNLKSFAPLLKTNSLVIDVCSVKEYPVQWMMEELPQSVSILATHPMFGPDSAADSLQDRKICLCKVRISEKKYNKIKNYLISKGLIVIEATAQEHDEQIATSLSLTHFIGRTLSKSGAVPLEIDTEGYKRLLRILEVVERDTWQLFLDMHRYNPYAKEKRIAFMNILAEINSKLENS